MSVNGRSGKYPPVQDDDLYIARPLGVGRSHGEAVGAESPDAAATISQKSLRQREVRDESRRGDAMAWRKDPSE